MITTERITASQDAIRVHDDPVAAAAAAGLQYVNSNDDGLRRVRRGRGFSYIDSSGRAVAGVERERIAALAIPPAWTDVWICAQSHGHLQCTGVDDRGRKQYIYHERWRAVRDEAAFARLAMVGGALPAVRQSVAAQMRRRTVDFERICGGMVRLLDTTGIRSGSEAYERANDTVGLTTLRWRHVTVRQRAIQLQFPAKSGQHATIRLADVSLARLLRELRASSSVRSSSGQRVFRLGGEPIAADQLNEYIVQIAGEDITAKDFRSWRGTVSALRYLRPLLNRPPTQHHAVAAIDAAAAALRNTRAVARSHYVHPGLITAYAEGTLADLLSDQPGAASSTNDYLDADEQALWHLIPQLS